MSDLTEPVERIEQALATGAPIDRDDVRSLVEEMRHLEWFVNTVRPVMVEQVKAAERVQGPNL